MDKPLVDVCVLSGGVPRPLTYISSTEPTPAVGGRVRVPLRGRLVVGVVWGHREQWKKTSIRLRSVNEVIDATPVVTTQQLQLCQFIARYYHANLGAVLKLCIPPLLGKQPGPRQQRWIWPLATGEPLPTRGTVLRRLDAFIRTHLPPVSDIYAQRVFPGCRKHLERLQELGRVILRTEPLPPDFTQLHLSSESSQTQIHPNPDQQRVIQTVLAATESGGSFLLEGVTGSGKTEVYMRVAAAMLEQGKSVLVVAPEIALTPLLVTRFTAALHTKILLLHSGLTQAQKRDTFFALLQEEPRVVVGARSALFAPLPRLGLIVVDEEHDTSHKHEGYVPYHSRDVALWRAKNEKALAILGSATPALESCHNVTQGKLAHLHLPRRIGGRGMLPKVQVVDLRARAQHAQTRWRDRAQSEGQALCILSEPLRQAMEQALRHHRQAMLFLNRRGYAAFALCDACGHVLCCPHCAVSLTHHKGSGALRCHQCGHAQPMCPTCPNCSGEDVLSLGLGLERVEQEVRQVFPDASVARLDSDSVGNPRELSDVLERMRAREIDILIGTQMIAKGHDFPDVAVVGVVLADIGLSMPDFRACERTFQTLTQVAGRAGRGKDQGKVFVQTFNPEHPAVAFAQHHDSEGFVRYELQIRRRYNQPPFTRTALLCVSGQRVTGVETVAQHVFDTLKRALTHYELQEACSVLGPAPAPIERLKDKYRYHIYLKTDTASARALLLEAMQNDVSTRRFASRHRCLIRFEVDPQSFL